MKSSIVLSVPTKFVAISPNPLQKIAPATITSPALLAMDDMSRSDSENGPVRKRKRLDHLTWEEKIQRKKLKNRMAAQTSRDRKKAKMDDMESTIHELTEKSEILQNKCETLEKINESLLIKNQKLDNQVQDLEKQLRLMQEQIEKQQQQAISGVDMQSNNINSDSNLDRSAESIFPLPKGLESEQMLFDYMNQQKKNGNCKDKPVTPLLKIIMLCLLYKICSKTSMSTNSKTLISKNLQNFSSQVSQKTWKEMIQRAALLMPKVQAKQSSCLDQWWGPHQNAWNPTARNLSNQLQDQQMIEQLVA